LGAVHHHRPGALGAQRAPCAAISLAATWFTRDPRTSQVLAKNADYTGEFRHEPYNLRPEVLPEDKGLVVGSPARKHAISSVFATPIVTKDTGIVAPPPPAQPPLYTNTPSRDFQCLPRTPSGLPEHELLLKKRPLSRLSTPALRTTREEPPSPFTGLVIQYELLLKNGLDCGGAYLKLLTAGDDLSSDT